MKRNVLYTGIEALDLIIESGSISKLKFAEHKNIEKIDSLSRYLNSMPAIRYLDVSGLETSKSREDILLDLFEVNFKIYDLVHKREMSGFTLELILDACESVCKYKDNIVLVKCHQILEELLKLIEDLPLIDMNPYFNILIDAKEFVFRREIL